MSVSASFQSVRKFISGYFLFADHPGVIPSCPESQSRVVAPQRIPNYKGKCSEFGATVSELPFVD